MGDQHLRFLHDLSELTVGGTMKLIENSRNYYVTQDGRVFSGNKEMKQTRTKQGYLKVRIYYEDGTNRDQRVHRLVAQAYIPNPLNKEEVNHIDADKTNNDVSNLEWMTRAENMKHAQENKLITYGFETANSCYNEEQIRKVFQLMQEGWRYKDISKETGVGYQHIINLRNNTRHKDIASEYDVPPPRSTKISVETVRWICRMLELGYKDKEIVKLSNNPLVNKTKVRFIRTKYTFTDISKDYSF